MGTRHLVMVKLNNKIKVAQYGQWDGYLTGQGHTIAEFLKTVDLNKFRSQVEKLDWISDHELKVNWIKCGANPDSDSVSMSVSDKFRRVHPELSRDTGAEVLKLIAKGRVKKVKNSKSFLKESLFCEYAYELNLNKEIVNIYLGFQKSKTGDGYGPCKIFKKVKFKDFTKEYLTKLEETLNKGED